MKFETTTQEIHRISPAELTLHQVALATPRMSDVAYMALKKDIEVNGQVDPVVVYRNKIVDGRHRWLILQELEMDVITYVVLPNNTTIAELKALVQSKETRRHETQAQLAIRAYREKIDPKSTYKSFAEAAAAIGAHKGRVSDAKQIAESYGRPDILQAIFEGEKFNTGTAYAPNWSDSLPAILKWLSEHGRPLKSGAQLGKIKPRTELTEDEQLLVNTYVNALCTESKMVMEAIASRLYSVTREGETNE